MVRAAQASFIALPQTSQPPATVFDYFCQRFDNIPASVWRERFSQGKVHWQDGELLDLTTPYRPQQKVYYYREVANEAPLPFDESILYEDEQIVLVNKPHFMALHPSGSVINQCLVNRVRARTGCDQLVAAHRLDRATAGIVLLVKQSAHRDAYHGLFRYGQITKRYQALAKLTPELLADYRAGKLTLPKRWTVKNRIDKGTPSLIMCVVDGEPNSHSEIALIGVEGEIGRFELMPISGKTHQLRLHMNSLGMPILNDNFYPKLQPKGTEDITRPMKLLAQQLTFKDPVSGRLIDITLPELSLDEG
ncbi:MULTISPECIES: pseudouridine synthase [Shewanella]|uniref:Pseudouridine synthase n=1 Tax=Shewanella marisflavi TaxID=260364 RepID=A0ABX5WVU3_9GAMM|nr:MULTISPECIES: pseudouridine synthase [Shewanella]QDF76629.1 pseudouridine synthase [Shewanella marisflavi]